MNTGIFGEGFPYSDFHNLNMDWIIKIAKDFLDQYTTIQETIDNGLTSLENKKDELEALLQAWYDTHSEDIATQLADALLDIREELASAIADLNDWYTTHEHYLDNTLQTNIAAFIASADAKATDVLESIPDDYTDLGDKADYTKAELEQLIDIQADTLARGNFKRNAYNPQSQSEFSYPYRISARKEMKFPYDIDLEIADGFRINPYLKNSSNEWELQGWKTGTYRIYANVGFYAQIARATEDTSETANITTFLNAVKVHGNPIEETTSYIRNVQQIIKWYPGGLQNNASLGRVVYNPALTDRMISQKLPLTIACTALVKQIGYRYGLAYFDEDDNFIAQAVEPSATTSVNTYYSLTVQWLKNNYPAYDPSTVYVRFFLIHPNSTISPDDADDLINIIYQNPTNPIVDSGKLVKIYKFGGAGNDWCFVRTPTNYNPFRIKPYPFVICNHGNGWVMDGTEQFANWTKRTMYVPLDDPDYLRDPTEYNGTSDESLWYSNPTIEALLSAGYVVCGCENYGDLLYGNNNCRNACVDFFFHMINTWNVEKRCYMIGASNGALTALNAAYLLQGRVKALILQYPLTCLVNQYESNSSQQAGIRDAYGISDTDITPSELAVAVATHDPLTTDVINGVKAGTFPPTKIWYSPEDVIARANYNAIPFIQMLTASNKVVSSVACTGEHGDHTHFNPSAFVNWFNNN